MPKKFLVTGGAGFIGANLVNYLVKRGNEIIVVDNLSTGQKSNLKEVERKIEFIEASSGDCLSFAQLKNLDGIFHLGIPSSSPLYKENHNLTGEAINAFIAILDLAKREKCKLIYASTFSIYNGNSIPFKEDMEVFPKDFYAEARYFMERMAKLYFDLWGVKSIGLRFSSVYGKGEESKKNLANMVSQIIWWIQDNKNPILYGNGEQTRDFVYIKDVVLALCLAMDFKARQDVFNVATGESCSLNQVVETVNNILGKDIKPKFLFNPVQNYVDLHLGNTTKAENVLGFKAQYSLEQGIKDILE